VVGAAEENVALFFHLTGAFLLVSGSVVAAVAFESARRRRLAGEIALLLGLARIGVALVGAGVLLVVPFGLWLVHIEHVGYGATWIDAALGLLVVVVAIGGAGGQAPKRARQIAAGLGDGEPASPELRALLDDPGARALNYSAGLLLAVIIALMVFKPGGAA
jgi:hypothetical protein